MSNKSNSPRSTISVLRFARSGALAGAASTVVFTVVHELFIGDIWFSPPFMLVAGVLCGLCIAGSY